jgi:hypothetical protein
MREKGVKSIINSKKNDLNSCPRPRASLHSTVVDALKIPATKLRSNVGIVPTGARTSFT